MPHSGPYPPLESLGHRANRYPFPDGISIWAGDIHSTLHNWLDYVHHRLWKQADRQFISNRYHMIIGVDSKGVIKGYDYAKGFHVPLVYISFEIFFRDEMTSKQQIREKRRECAASQFAEFVIIQDRKRKEFLGAENGIPAGKFEYLPVSPKGTPRAKSSDYLRKRYNIAESQVIVLHAGSFGDWTYAGELLDNATRWPDDFVLVIHTRHKPKWTNRYIRTVKHADKSNIILSTDPLPVDQYEQLVASADIGLTLYKTVPSSLYLQKNLQVIGLASGKFSVYMKYGLPVISIGQQSYAELLVDYAFGRNLESFEQMPNTLTCIWSNYAHHQAEALRLFAEKLDFNIHWPRIENRLLECLSRK
jgi:hypothetical protein